MDDENNKQIRRETAATQLHVSMDLLEKAIVMLDVEWTEEAAERNLLYCMQAAAIVRDQMENARAMFNGLLTTYRIEEERATRP